MNPEPEYILEKEYLNGPIVAYYKREVDQPFGCNFGGVPFYNALALSIVDNDEVKVQERKEDEENQPTGPLFVSEDGGITYVATGQELPPLKLIETTIDGRTFLDSYIEGYTAGRKHFDDLYLPSASIVYGSEAKEYTENLHNLYKHKELGLGWERLAKQYSRFVTHKAFREYGCYAGLCHSIDQLVDKYPHLADAIKVCHSKPQVRVSNDEETKKSIRLILAPLGGINPQKSKIMNQEDFDRLLNHTEYLVLTNSVPPKMTPVSQTGISNEHIRYTFYRLHKHLFGTKHIRVNFIDFIHAVFLQFSGTTTATTKAIFSRAPKSYQRDFADYIDDEL